MNRTRVGCRRIQPARAAPKQAARGAKRLPAIARYWWLTALRGLVALAIAVAGRSSGRLVTFLACSDPPQLFAVLKEHTREALMIAVEHGRRRGLLIECWIDGCKASTTCLALADEGRSATLPCRRNVMSGRLSRISGGVGAGAGR
jgi:hypothetical protein